MAGADETQGDQKDSWLINIKGDLAELISPSSSWSICKLPSKIRAINDAAYSPQIISIGPLHHGTKNVLEMEEHKSHYTLSLLHRTIDAEKTLDACGELILSLDGEVRTYYSRPIEGKKEVLARMLLYDGCFVLELFLRYFMDDARKQYDPIFNTSWMLSTIQRDLALLENQIPFVVLEKLFTYIVSHTATNLPTLSELALWFCASYLNANEVKFEMSSRNIFHLLDLIHSCLLPSHPSKEKRGKIPSKLISCATKLSEAGIEFQKGQSKHLLDLRFEDGVFKIPQLVVHDTTDSLFRNLIALEQCLQGRGQYVTSYALLMDRLVDATNDVELLGQKGIIENDLGGYEDVSGLFINICKQVVVRDFYFAELCEQVDAYYNKIWNRYKASLKRDYFTNPWTIISVIAGTVLLALTTLQTIYSVLSYYPS